MSIRYSLNNFKQAFDDMVALREVELTMMDKLSQDDIYMLLICLADSRNTVYTLLGDLGYAIFENDTCIREIEDIISRRSLQYILLQYKICFKHLISANQLIPANLSIDLEKREVIEYGAW